MGSPNPAACRLLGAGAAAPPPPALLHARHSISYVVSYSSLLSPRKPSQGLGQVHPAVGQLVSAGQAQAGVVWVEAVGKAHAHRHHAALHAGRRGWSMREQSEGGAPAGSAMHSLMSPPSRHAISLSRHPTLTSLGLSAALKLTMEWLASA